MAAKFDYSRIEGVQGNANVTPEFRAIGFKYSLELASSKPLTAAAGTTITALNYVQVEDLDAHTGKIVSAGGKVVHGKMPVPGMGWFAIATDPEGNAFGVWQNDQAARSAAP